MLAYFAASSGFLWVTDIEKAPPSEELVFTNSLFKKGFKLLIKENCKAIVEDVEYTGINTYLKSLPNFIKLINLLNKSKLLFLIDCLIFFNIHLLISIFNIFKIEIHKK